MKVQIEKTYHLLFYKLVKFTYMMNRRHYYHYELQNGLFGACCSVGMLFAIFVCFIFNCIEIFTGFSPWRNNAVMIGFVVFVHLSYVFIHFTLLSKDKWRKYEAVFETYSRKKNRKINIRITILAVLLISLLVISFMTMNIRQNVDLNI